MAKSNHRSAYDAMASERAAIDPREEARGFDRIRRRRWVSILFLPVGVMLMALHKWLGYPVIGPHQDAYYFFSACCLPLVQCVLIVRYMGSSCPRCGKSFFLRGFYGNAWSRRCCHCRTPFR